MLVSFLIDFVQNVGNRVARGWRAWEGVIPIFLVLEETRLFVSDYFERWQVLAALISKEHDPEKLTAIANEMNRVLTQRTLGSEQPLESWSCKTPKE